MSEPREVFVDFYALLGVKPDATTAQIRSAYRGLAKLLHPDVDGGDAFKMQELNRAHQALKDDKKRRVYDLMHQSETGTSSINYRYCDSSDGLHVNMSDDEIDDFINDVFTEFANQPVKSPLETLKKDLKSKFSFKNRKQNSA